MTYDDDDDDTTIYKGQQHVHEGRHTPGSRDECRTAPDGRRPLDQAHHETVMKIAQYLMKFYGKKTNCFRPLYIEQYKNLLSNVQALKLNAPWSCENTSILQSFSLDTIFE